MVRVHITRVRHPDALIIVEADTEGLRIEGPSAEMLDPSEAILGLPSGHRVAAADDPEQWARGLILRFRSPDFTATIVHDDDHALEAGAEAIVSREHVNS
jgi:hypothetical protein